MTRPLSRLLAKTPATPNQVSFFSFAIALASLGLFLSGYNIWAGVAVQLSSIVDGADGALARLKNIAARFGGYFDAVLDRYADIAILAAWPTGHWMWRIRDHLGLRERWDCWPSLAP